MGGPCSQWVLGYFFSEKKHPSNHKIWQNGVPGLVSSSSLNLHVAKRGCKTQALKLSKSLKFSCTNIWMFDRIKIITFKKQSGKNNNHGHKKPPSSPRIREDTEFGDKNHQINHGNLRLPRQCHPPENDIFVQIIIHHQVVMRISRIESSIPKYDPRDYSPHAARKYDGNTLELGTSSSPSQWQVYHFQCFLYGWGPYISVWNKIRKQNPMLKHEKIVWLGSRTPVITQHSCVY